MGTVALTMAGISGVALLAGAYHLMVGVRHQLAPGTHLSFGFMCLGLAGWAWSGVALYSATTPEAYLNALEWRLGLVNVTAGLLLWFFTFFGRERVGPAIWLLTAAHLGLFLANQLSPFTLGFSEMPSLALQPAIGGMSVPVGVGPAGPWDWLPTVVSGSGFVYSCWITARVWQRGERRAAGMLALALAVFALGVFGVLSPLIGAFPTAELGTMGLVLVVTLSMADEVVDASTVRGDLDRTRLQLSAIVDSAPEAILLLDGSTARAKVANRQALRLYQISEDAVGGYDPAKAAPPLQADGSESASMFERQFRIAMAGTRSRFPWLVLRGEGETIPAQALLVRLPGEDPPLVRMSVLDVRQLEAAEERSIKLEAQLRQAQKMEAVGRLTGGIAHDFNNLLTVIQGSLELLQKSKLESDSDRQLLDLAVTAANRSSALTQRLLAFSRRQPLSPTHVEAGPAIEEVAALLERTLGKEVHIEIDVPSTVSAVRVDPTQLESCLVNLAINASDAMPSGGRLTIGARNVEFEGEAHALTETLEPGRYVQFHVTDTGHGIDRTLLERIVEPFFTTKEVGKGTGLGLSAAYGFATQSGGGLKIESEVGAGTTVRVFLPPADDVSCD